MSVETIQKIAAVTIVAGGLGGGYYALTGGTTGTLSGMHFALDRELIENWEEVASKYKEKDQKDLIEGIKQTSSKLASDIQKWCLGKGSTYFLGETDQTYKSYSIWCLKEANIQAVLEKKGFKWDDSKWDKKLDKYKQFQQNFITQLPENKPIPLDNLRPENISKWCEDNRIQRYRYQGDQTEYRVRAFCYWTDEEILEANKPQPPQPPQPKITDPLQSLQEE
ncbi:hypothetical protein A6V39_05160 [Candidatus Mycoplasma haematobovis]|uniref:Uncharacterized protein n=1 Tax=Candidatus Mycoplasma haematobovis TaxID=432608 RepID=A0A1A9QBH8_9MOLU|nr:hypothetical protein [Candidatus Mycoplasma haematobovis]OAL09817.1 hypothetical protein A6V39_05160 [Candidatus Mycoplasma haematobovis]